MQSLVVLLAFLIGFAGVCSSLPVYSAESSFEGSSFRAGVGIGDVTGPAAEMGMMGYAMLNQKTSGILSRLFARAFIFDDGNKRLVFVNLDLCMPFVGIKRAVVSKLEQKYNGLYTNDNVMLSAIHTHAGPGGYSMYTLYEVTTLGFNRDHWDAVVAGIVAAVDAAHASLRPARLGLAVGKLQESNVNRSPSSYLLNPDDERASYPDGDTDKDMTVLRVSSADGAHEIGTVAWFAVHGTSLNNTNPLIAGDNKGYASYLFEQSRNGPDARPGQPGSSFVAAFGQTNEGDVSPNTRGAFCPDGSRCDFQTSTCGGRTENCRALGPGATDAESMRIIGGKQAARAHELWELAGTGVMAMPTTSVDYRHQWADMSNISVTPAFATTAKQERTCPAAMGYSFAGGTTDGPGDFDFTQGSTKGNAFWNIVSGFLAKPSADRVACHHPKPILLDVGDIGKPGPWVEETLPLQIFRIGALVLVGVPAEFTTMSGRRLRATVRSALGPAYAEGLTIVIAGLSNAYSHYVATYEEYQAQRYEAASTLFGPHTLAAYQQLYASLAQSLSMGTPAPPSAPAPPDISKSAFNIRPGVVLDTHPISGRFGSVYKDVSGSTVSRGTNTTVAAVFWGAHPNNNYRNGGSFLAVERKSVSGSWETYRLDADFDTRYRWKRSGIANSLVTVEWDLASDTPAGTYRLRTFGTAKSSPTGSMEDFEGVSSEFAVTAV